VLVTHGDASAIESDASAVASDASAVASDASVGALQGDATAARPDARVSSPGTLGTREAVARRGEYLRAVVARADQISLDVSSEAPCTHPPSNAHVRLALSVRHTECDTLGPITFSPNATAGILEVWLWQANSGCSSAEVTTTTTTVVLLKGSPGSYALKVGDVTKGTLTLGASGAECKCSEGSLCVHELNADRACGAACELACDNVVGCMSGARGKSCDADATCAPGLICKDGSCTWSVDLRQETRKPCSSHTDCIEGLACVEGQAGKLGCEVPCNAEVMACPGPHYCTRNSSYAGAHWVCEWIGE
jgi:hypothetical protein